MLNLCLCNLKCSHFRGSLQMPSVFMKFEKHRSFSASSNELPIKAKQNNKNNLIIATELSSRSASFRLTSNDKKNQTTKVVRLVFVPLRRMVTQHVLLDRAESRESFFSCFCDEEKNHLFESRPALTAEISNAHKRASEWVRANKRGFDNKNDQNQFLAFTFSSLNVFVSVVSDLFELALRLIELH